MGTKTDELDYLDDFTVGSVDLYGNPVSTNVSPEMGAIDATPEDISASYTVNSVSSTNSGQWQTGKLTITGGSGQWQPNTGGGNSGGWTTIYPGTTVYPSIQNDEHPIYSTTDSTHITIYDENGNLKRLGIAEVSRYYGEALEYRRIKRFARLFPMVRELLNELLVSIKLSDPYDDEELDRMEEELREQKKNK